MKIWYDVEFVEDGRTVELISIGMVREDGAELYLVNEEIDDWIVNDNGENELYKKITRGSNAPFLMEHVIPHLPLRVDGHGKPIISRGPGTYANSFHLDTGDNRVVSRRYIRNAVRDFVLGPVRHIDPEPASETAPTEDREPIELWAWYGAYDYIALCQLFGRMVDLPKGFPMYTRDIQQLADHYKVDLDELVPQPQDAHNALADARWNRDAFNAMTGGMDA